MRILRFIVRYFLLLYVIVSCTSATRQEDAALPNQPNVVLIMTDDQGWGDLSIHGNPVVETPVLDQFAREGIQLKNFYVSPLCAPTRASLLTGRYHLRTGTRWVSDGLENMQAEEYTLAEMFKNAGYATGCFGKWHNGAHHPFHPNQQGFGEFIGFCAGHWNNYFNTTLERNGTAYPTEGYITDVLTEEAISFIRRHQNQPFFCYVPYNVPHSPFQLPDSYFNKYYNRLDTMTDETERSKRASVYGMCENVDDNVGRILTTLDELKLRENTIVIYLSDNGPNGARYNGGMRGTKGSTHEGGTRVPFFLQWPDGLPQASVVDGIAAHIDVLPTLAALCGLSLPSDRVLDGKDLSENLIQVNSTIGSRTLFFQQSDRELLPYRGALRTDAYRLVHYPNYTGLYDLRNDPDESEDLSQELPRLRDSLMQVYNQWFARMQTELVDVNIIPIGFEDQQKVILPAHESRFSGNVQFKEGHGWAHDWLVNWRDTSDRIHWTVEVKEPSTWTVFLSYTTPKQDIGAVVQLQSKNANLSDTIVAAFNPEYIPSPDRIPRKEVYEKEWAQMALGYLTLSPGTNILTLRALAVPGKQVAEIRNITFVKK